MDLTGVLWRKSSRSSEQGDMCVELALVRGAVAIRDSRDPDGSKLMMSRRSFGHLAAALKRPSKLKG
ncbi:DUF397 domain-containing protein [Actinomadura sp. SCN-SB]|uniref:DUF397 domain-containing protein n=1 Tax=Actinomadura sp. SCN-SB TaxID=3373092 RepID=UPI0037511FEB